MSRYEGRWRGPCGQRVAVRGDDHPLPAVGGEREARDGSITRAADDGQIDSARFQPGQHIGIAGRLQVHADLRIAGVERRDRGGQGEAGLGVGGRDAQFTAGFVAQVRGDRADVGGLGQDDSRAFDHLFAGMGDRVEALALAHEQLEAQLVLQLPELLAEAGLGCMDALSAEGNDLWIEMQESKVIVPGDPEKSRAALIYGQMTEPPGARLRVGLTGLAVAEYFRDVEGLDVLLFIDNIFRFVQAGSEVSALLGRMPSAVGYQPNLNTEIGELQERITSTKHGSITSVQAIYVPADDYTDPAPAATFTHLDT